MDTPLFNKEYENVVLGTIIRNNELYSQNDDVLSDNLFYDDYNKLAWKCVSALIERDKVARPVQLAGYAKEIHCDTLDAQFFIQLTALNNTDSFPACLGRLVEYAKRRSLWNAAQRFSSKIYDLSETASDSITALSKEITEVSESESSSIKSASELFRGVISMAEANMNSQLERGIMTGFRVFDDVCGFHRGQLITVAAMSGVGKTSLALNMATNQAIAGHAVAYYSLEMPGEELMARVISSVSKIPSSAILYRPLTQENWKLLDKTIGQLGNLPIYVDESSTTTFERTCRSIREMVLKKNVKVAYIDYLQIYMSSANSNESDEKLIASMARGFKNLAKELGIVIVILSQISRNREDFHPRMNRMRGSGQIQDASDMVLLIDRPEGVRDWLEPRYEGVYEKYSTHQTALLKLTKGRNTGENETIVRYSAETTTFYDSLDIPLKDSFKSTVASSKVEELTSEPNKNELPF
jgi:replicative DNA helicase